MSDPITPAEPVIEPDPAGGAPRTFTQEEVNRIVAADRRKDKDELAAALAEIDALRPKAQKADELEAAQLTAAELAEKRAAEAEARLAELDARVKASERKEAASAAALKVAKELGVSADAALLFADRLMGDSAEAMEADARTVLAHLTPTAAPAPAAADDALAGTREAGEAAYQEAMKRGDIAAAVAAKNALYTQ